MLTRSPCWACATPEFERLFAVIGENGWPLWMLMMLLMNQPFITLARNPLSFIKFGK